MAEEIWGTWGPARILDYTAELIGEGHAVGAEACLKRYQACRKLEHKRGLPPWNEEDERANQLESYLALLCMVLK